MEMITKTEFLLFRKHPAWLWLYKNDRTKLPRVDANLLQLFEDGKELEAYAERRFDPIRDFQGKFHPGETYRQVKFAYGNFECTTDLICVHLDGSLQLIEIKSSTSAKEVHIEDLAFQRLVVEDLGFTVGGTAVLHINNGYLLDGEVDPDALFTETDVSERVDGVLELVRRERGSAFTIAGSETIPDQSPRFCLNNDVKKEWLTVLRQLRAIPDASIYELPYLTLGQIGELEDLGITLIAEIPDSFKLRKDQERLRDSLRRNEVNCDIVGWRDFLGQLQYPLYFLDYETLGLAVPQFQGTKPYQQVTFQFSIHVQTEPGGELSHYEYIHREATSPLEPLARELREAIGDSGSVIVWNEAFERSRNTELCEATPELADFLTSLNHRMIDLMKPFKNGLYDDPSFLGSASIKRVLPVLAPDLSYKELEVQEGKSASRIWRQAVVEPGMSDADRAAAIKNLGEYCKLDTLAMVRILGRIYRLVS